MRLGWLLQPPTKLDATQKATVAQVEHDRKVKKAGALARRFVGRVKASSVDHRKSPASRLTDVTRRMRIAATCDMPALETLAPSLRQDAVSVRATLTTRWSDGQTEGHINKLKLPKRQM